MLEALCNGLEPEIGFVGGKGRVRHAGNGNQHETACQYKVFEYTHWSLRSYRCRVNIESSS